MSTIRDIKSNLNQKALDALCTKYHIPACVHLILPGPNKNILQSLGGKIGVYNRFFEFANYRVPLSQFLIDVLDHFHIHLSQLSVFGAAKVSHFKILCRVHGFQPSVNCFRMFYTSSYTKGWMSFVKRSDAVPVCYSKPLDSMKNWNDYFFWVDSTAFPLSISIKSKILSKDPPPKLSRHDTEACEFLRTHTASFWKFLEPFLCWVGISRYYTLEMDLFAFIRHSDPTKVRIRERELAEREVGLLKMTEGRTVPLTPPSPRPRKIVVTVLTKEKGGGDASGSAYPPKKLRGDHQSLLPNVGGKSLAALQGMVPASFAIPSGVTEPLIAAFVAPVSDARPLDSVSEANLRTCPPHVRYVVSSDGSRHSGSYSETSSFVESSAVDVPVVNIVVTTVVDADVTASSKAKDMSKYFENIGDSTSAGGVNADAANISRLKKTSTSSDSFYASQSLDIETMHCVYIPRWKVTNDSTLDDSYVCLVGRIVFLRAEVRMQAEHTLEKKRELESNQLSVMQTTDAAKSTKLRDLKEENFALEGEKSALSERVTTLESITASKEDELASLSSQVAKITADLCGFQLSRNELNSKVASLESERDCLAAQKSLPESAFELLMERIEALQDEQTKALGALGWAIGCAVNKGIQDGLKARIDHGKVRRNLSVVEAYDPSAEEKYDDAVNALGTVDFYLLFELESKKDSSIVINLRVQRFREEAKEKRLSLADVMTPFVEPLSSKSLTGEASTSDAPITTLSTTFASSAIIPPSSVVSDQDLDAKPHSEDPPAMTFEKEELSTSP
uniref:Transposase (putative) gypsy type domain-containing protein n=1 Tax=Tanacetum cinerariifolium TaxID=118510 RepID=A0A6L2L8P6_TANCI|nr:hypothetical protein [Tanacetum cinerariifolium]